MVRGGVSLKRCVIFSMIVPLSYNIIIRLSPWLGLGTNVFKQLHRLSKNHTWAPMNLRQLCDTGGALTYRGKNGEARMTFCTLC